MREPKLERELIDQILLDLQTVDEALEKAVLEYPLVTT